MFLRELKTWLDDHYAKQKENITNLAQSTLKETDTPANDKVNFDLDFELLSQENTSTQCTKDKQILQPVEIECGRSVHKRPEKLHENITDRIDIEHNVSEIGTEIQGNVEHSNNTLEKSDVYNNSRASDTSAEINVSNNEEKAENNSSEHVEELDKPELNVNKLTVPKLNEDAIVIDIEDRPLNTCNSEIKECSVIHDVSDILSDIPDDVIANLDFTTPNGKDEIERAGENWSKGTAIATSQGETIQVNLLMFSLKG